MITGLHHVTAIASDPQKNLDFYTKFLGLRLVKKTVNFDDPGTYHFYFGDQTGSPGTILTFFGFIHGEAIGIGSSPTVSVAYLGVAGILFALSKFAEFHPLPMEMHQAAEAD